MSEPPVKSEFAPCTGLVLSLLLLTGAAGCADSEPPQSVPITDSSRKEEQPAVGFNFSPSLRRPRSAASGDHSVPALSVVSFADVASETGLKHRYQNGAQGQLLMVEAMGGGWAWLDYDCDGFPDAFLNQGGSPLQAQQASNPKDALYRNLEGRQLIDRADHARLSDLRYGQGCASADFNNDGFSDLYLTNLHGNVLHMNLGDGTFLDVTRASRTFDDRWSTSAAWCDLNLDGNPDLYVCNYLQYDPDHPLKCERGNLPAMCHPRDLAAWPDAYFENRGDGTFQECAADRGLTGPENKALGVAVTDLNGDGLPDVYVCNDTSSNFLFLNRGSTFLESASRYGVARNSEGHNQASMGIAVHDFDGNGLQDLYLTHFTFEWNTFYRNLGAVGFEDASHQTGLAELTMRKLGFGAASCDFNGDGSVEVFTANGHIDSNNFDGDGYEMHPQLMSFFDGRFSDITSTAGDYFQRKYVGRGVALSDYDLDGDVDLGVVHQNEMASLLQNQLNPQRSIRIRLTGTHSSRDAFHSRITVIAAERSTEFVIAGGTSYCSSHDRTIVVPVDRNAGDVQIDVRWPSGRQSAVRCAESDRSVTIIEPE